MTERLPQEVIDRVVAHASERVQPTTPTDASLSESIARLEAAIANEPDYDKALKMEQKLFVERNVLQRRTQEGA